MKEAGIENLEGFELLSGDEADQQTSEAKDVISVIDSEQPPEVTADQAPQSGQPEADGTPSPSPFDLSVDPFAPKPQPKPEDEFF